jgi:fatty-acyl-CoA synthase
VRWRYRDLERHARRVAKAVLATGIGKGARVGVLMGNRPEAVASLFGTALAGAVAVPLSTFSPKPELSYLLAHADISVLSAPDGHGQPPLRGRCRRAVPGRRRTVAHHRSRVSRTCGTLPPSVRSRTRAASISWESFLQRGDALVDDALLDAAGGPGAPVGSRHHHLQLGNDGASKGRPAQPSGSRVAVVGASGTVRPRRVDAGVVRVAALLDRRPQSWRWGHPRRPVGRG